MSTRRAYFTLALAGLLLLSPALMAADSPATVHRGAADLTFQAPAANDGGTLTVAGPDGFVDRQVFSPASSFRFEVSGEMPDGLYTFELVLTPKLDADTRRAMAQARKDGDDAVEYRLRAAGKLPAEALVTQGFFTLQGGTLVSEDLVEEEGAQQNPRGAEANAGTNLGVTAEGSNFSNISAADFVILDDLIVDGSACVGFDCVNGESFGFDTLRLKENNLRIKFQDTSSAGSFPSNDWQLTANDSANGGASKFSIDDIDGGRTPFTIEARAPSHSLYVDDGGRLGLGTSIPSVDAHVVSGNTPTLRLDQNGSSGFAPQIWDVAGNETSFFVRDVTNGSSLPFRIRPGASSQALVIDSDNDIGLGILSPSAALHLRRTDGNAGVLIEEASGTEAVRDMLRLVNNGRPRWRMEDTSPNGQILTVRLAEGDLDFSFSANTGDEVEMMDNGDMTIAGTLTENSDRDKKHNIVPVAQDEILAKVMQLPIATWERIVDEPDIQHMGPMAQDFFALFGLGDDNRHIATIDTSGVALAAIQALGQKLEAKQGELEALKAQNSDLLERLIALEAKIAP